MGWRVVVVTNPSKLDYSMGYLAVRDVEKTTRVHLDEISVLIVENTASSVTAALLSQLTERKNQGDILRRKTKSVLGARLILRLS